MEQESVALLMIPDLLAVRAQLKKLLSLAFFQDHCVLISCIKIFGFAPFLLLPSFHCFNHSNQYSTLHSMLMLGQWTPLLKPFLNALLVSMEGNQHT